MRIIGSVVGCWLFLAVVLMLTGCSGSPPTLIGYQPIPSGDSGPPELDRWEGPGPGQGVRRVDVR